MFKKGFHNKPEYATVKPRRNEVPDGLLQKCPECGQVFLAKDWEKHWNVCPACDYHRPLSAPDRIRSLVDEGWQEWDADLMSADPLQFPSYTEKLEKDQEKTNLKEAVVTGTGLVGGYPVAIGVMDSRFRMGSMGSVVGEKIARAAERAGDQQMPFILFSASGGARMQEGVLSLMQMAKTSAALERLSRKRCLFLSVLTNPTTGGVAASFSSLGDITIAEPGALIGFAGRRVIEQTVRQQLPEGFQTAEFLLEHGQLDQVVHRRELKEWIIWLLRQHHGGRKGDT